MDKEEVIKEFKKLFPNGDPRFYEIIIELCQLHNDKNNDYATQSQPLGNFTRVGTWIEDYKLIVPGRKALKTSIIYMLKQLDAALKLIGNEQKGQVEDAPKRLADIAVYSIIAMILYEKDL